MVTEQPQNPEQGVRLQISSSRVKFHADSYARVWFQSSPRRIYELHGDTERSFSPNSSVFLISVIPAMPGTFFFGR
jgi:hypothetical protein